MVQEWVKNGNSAGWFDFDYGGYRPLYTDIPMHSSLSLDLAYRYCVLDFPSGRLDGGGNLAQQEVGDSLGQVLPGLYEFRTFPTEGNLRRVPRNNCVLRLNRGEGNEGQIKLPHGKPFTFRLFTHHGWVSLNCGYMYRIGD